MTAPTEAEIREVALDAFREVMREHASGWDVPWVYDLSAPLRYEPPDEDGEPALPWLVGLWTDLRPSQAARLSDLREAIYERADVLMVEAADRIVDAVVEAALTFAAEYPDAPRAKPEAVPA